jgi:branched-chain amino acid aminotransferase
MSTGDLKPDGSAWERWIAVNGRIVPETDARISCEDRGFLYGDGLFETMKARQGCVDFLQRHLERMQSGARDLDIPFPPHRSFPPLIRELLAKNQLQETAVVKLCLSRGRHTGPLTLYKPEEATLVMFARPWEEEEPSRWEQGLSITVETEIRQNALSGICHMKTLNYLAYLRVRTRAARAGFEDAILLNTHGELCECTTANLFWFRGGQLETPEASCGLLPGVVRAVVMDLMEQAGTPVREVRRSADDLPDAEEIFVSNSVVEILPVGRIGERRLPRRDQTRALRERFRAYRDSLHPDPG